MFAMSAYTPLAMICELQRDWARTETRATFQRILFGPPPIASIAPQHAAAP
jgi:hypothetical protein